MVQAGDLYSARKKLGLSQGELAEKLGVSRNTISRWERGDFNPSGENLIALNRLFAQLEESAPAAVPAAGPAPAEMPPPKEEPAPPKAARWPFVLACAGIICSLLIGIAALIEVHSLRQELTPDNVVPVEEIEGEEVDESIIMEPITFIPEYPG